MTGNDDLTLLVDALRRDRRRDPYKGRREYSRAARELAGHCERLLAAGDAAAAVPVLRKAVDRMTTALTRMDDSSGTVGADLRHMTSLYARACAAAPPNPASLARWLVTLAYDGPGWPEIRLAEFAPALGKRGLAETAARVEQRAAAEAGPEGQRFATRDLREQLAEVSGDVDRHVAVLAEHLTGAEQYRRIVTVLRDAGRPGEAVDWARRGLAAHDDDGPYADRLRDSLVDLLVDTGDLDAATARRRADFERRPSARAYRALADTAKRCGTGPGHGTWAVGVLRERTAHRPAYAADLVAVLLADGEADQAWQVGLDHLDTLPEAQLAELLDMRRRGQPADVLAPYQALVEARVLDSTDKRRYQNSVALLRSLRTAYLDLGDPAGFDAYLDQLRTAHKRRPTFLAHLDAAGL